MKTTTILLATLFAFTTIFTGCTVQKKVMKDVYSMIKSSFPDAKIKKKGNRILLTFPETDMFEVGSSDLKPKFNGRVDRFAEVMNKYQNVKLIVTGHTDNTGEASKNMKLSLDRATNVKAAIVDKSIGANRIYSSGVGQTKPIMTNDTEEGRAQNRRVDFEIYYSK